MNTRDAVEDHRDERADLGRYLNRRDVLYKFESNMVLVVDADAVPTELLETLLTPDDDAKCAALLADRAIEWYPEDRSRDNTTSELQLTPGLGFNHQTTFCPLCGHLITPDALAWFSRGRPVCRCCTPDDLVEHSRRAHEIADKVAPLGSATDDEWAAAICRYASNLERDESP